MSPDQLHEHVTLERSQGIFLSILARCTGCGLGYTSIPREGVECWSCGEAVEYWPAEIVKESAAGSSRKRPAAEATR